MARYSPQEGQAYPSRQIATSRPEEAPEVVPGTAPEVVPGTAPELVLPPSTDYYKNRSDQVSFTLLLKWRRRCVNKKYGIGIIIGAIAIVALIVGIIKGRHSSKSRSPANPVHQSACGGTICSQILTAAVDSNQSLYVFARGTDNGIWYASTDIDSLSPSWPNHRPWQNLKGGPFRSEPAVAAWEQSKVLTVAAVTDQEATVHVRTFNSTTSKWNDTWEDLGGAPKSAVSLCTVNLERLDLWIAQDDTTIAHNLFNETTGDYIANSLNRAWQDSASFVGNIKVKPAVTCRFDTFLADLVVYTTNGTLEHSSWSIPGKWATEQDPFPNNQFQGDPVLLATTNRRFDFFGITIDSAMNHFNWQDAIGYSSMDDLGGSFQSVPSAVATNNGSRIDVMALGSNGTLLHRVLQDTTWSPNWEDLGVVGNSAPLLVNLTTNTQPEKIAIFVVGRGGEVNQTTWTVSSDHSWRNLTWSGMGGNITSASYQV